ncbi:hypothetical protein [Candidatus Poriferisodalis sp.]|uniref:hypothetical protein n=1 Tax=Candidatus Poriferisodalis sp. TaxID=3101277 RepID=UPI003B5A33D1
MDEATDDALAHIASHLRSIADELVGVELGAQNVIPEAIVWAAAYSDDPATNSTTRASRAKAAVEQWREWQEADFQAREGS